MISLSCLSRVKRSNSGERPPVAPHAHLVSINVDTSGSMASFGGAQTGQILETLAVLKEVAISSDVETWVSIWTFDGHARNPVEPFDVRSGVLPTMTELREYFYPSGMTALYDSSKACVEQLVDMKVEYIKRLPAAVRRANPEIKATYYLLTDGEDTASMPNSRQACVLAMRAARKDHGVMDIFLGANIDAKTTAASMGFSGHAYQMAATPEACATLMKTVTSMLRQTSQGSSDPYEPDNDTSGASSGGIPMPPLPPGLPVGISLRPTLRRY